MAELSPKKLKKEKKRLSKLAQELNESKQDASEADQSSMDISSNHEHKKKKKKKKEKADSEMISNGDHTNQSNVNTDNNSSDSAVAASPKKFDKSSNARSAKKRMLADCEYFSHLMDLVNIPRHLITAHQQDGGGDGGGGKVPAGSDSEDDDDDVVLAPGDKQRFHQNSGDAGNRAATHGELRERLHAKMAEIRARNEATNEARAARKNKIKLKRLEERAGADSKKKSGKENKDDKLKEKLSKLGKKHGSGNKLKAAMEDAGGVNTRRPHVKTETGQVVFSKFDFATSESVPEAGKKKHMDPAAALAKIEKRKEKLKMWEEKGREEKVKRIEDQTVWQSAMDKATGAKVKDDEALLKKALKRQQQKKKSSQKKWETRIENVEKRKEGAQNKRKDNIKKRKDQKKEGKMKFAIKKGRKVPGV